MGHTEEMVPAQPDRSQTPSLPDDLFTDRAADSTGAGGEAVTLSLTHAPMVRVGLLANKYRQLTSKFYLREFGVGATDWRTLVVLTKSPDVSAGEISALIGIDKAAVSRSLHALARLDMASSELRSPSDPRVQLWRLTADGQELHSRMLTASLRINKTLLTGFGEQEVALLLQFTDSLLDNLDLLADELDGTRS